ncbi:unnamed protein product, partial [Pleuronectes platessa]
ALWENDESATGAEKQPHHLECRQLPCPPVKLEHRLRPVLTTDGYKRWGGGPPLLLRYLSGAGRSLRGAGRRGAGRHTRAAYSCFTASPPTSLRRREAVTDPTRGDVVGEVEEKEVGGKGEEEGGVGSKQVEEKTGGEKSIEQDGGDSGRRGGEAAEGRMAWSEQVEEEEMEEEAPGEALMRKLQFLSSQLEGNILNQMPSLKEAPPSVDHLR